ncbi:MAG TPA: hypothetical protein VFU57_02175, partial [Candidatus Acidoferrales bacterium]|nr:hypothetical protein [Candidatus Acidoferrales bacterium]
MFLSKGNFVSAIRRIGRFVAANKFSMGLPALTVGLIVIMLPLPGQGPKRERPEHEKDSSQLIRKRAQWFFHQRAYPLKHIPAGARVHAMQQLQQMRAANGTFMQRLLQKSGLPNFNTAINTGARALTISSSNWTAIGPAPTNSTFFSQTSGRVNALAVDPCDASGNTIYAGGAQGGLWVTTNGGANWTPLTDSQLSLATGSLAVDPTGCPTRTVYVGTGEENFAFDSFYGAGVLKCAVNTTATPPTAACTKDNTFVNVTAGTPSTITPTNAGVAGPFIGSLAVQPGTSGAMQVLLAGIQGVSSMANSGIWRSSDGGANWARVLPPVGGAGFPAVNDFGTGVVFDPNNANIAYAALGIPFCASNVCGSSGDEELDNGVYKSTDGGATWKLLTALDTAAGPVGGQGSYGRITITVGPPALSGQPGELLVSIANIQNQSSSLLGLFQSTDGGNTFSLLMDDSAGAGFCDQQCFYDMSIGISPSDPNLIFLGGGPAAGGSVTTQCGPFPSGQGISTVIRSTDGGNTWSDVSCDATSQTFIHVDTHAFAFSPNGKLYTGNDGGVWSSSNVVTGAAPTQVAWSDLNTTLNLTQFYPGASVHPSNPQIALAGSQDNGTPVFSGNLTWNDTDACGDGGWTAIDPQVPSTVYAACAATGSFEVNKNQVDGVPGPNAENWIGLDNAAMDSDSQNFIPPFVLDPSNPQNLYFGTFRVWQSANGGISWNIISPDLTGSTSNPNCSQGQCVITSLAVAPSSSGTIYVGTDVGRIWVSNNVNSISPTFTEIDQANTPGRVVTQVVASPATPNTAFAAFSGFSGFNDNLGHIFETTNGGQSWTDISGNLPNTPVNDIVVDPDNVTNSTVYVATDVGVFVTTNAGVTGTTWSELASGLPQVECTSLKLNETARILQVGTHGRGIWDLQLPFAAGITSALTGISPASTAAGSSSVTMTLTGFGFPASPTVNFGSGTQLTPTSATSTQITVSVPASALASAGEVAVSITGAQNSLNFG